MCVMGPTDIKADIYNVMTNSRELTNYCQESVNSIHSKKISNSLNNFHLKEAREFITKLLTQQDQLYLELNEIEFDDTLGSEDRPIYNKVIDYIESCLIQLNK